MAAGASRSFTVNVRLVINQEISSDQGLVSGQDDLLQKVMAKVSLHPRILNTHTHTNTEMSS